jgi:hypothetical protein
MRRKRARLRAGGLTTRGTVPRYNLRPELLCQGIVRERALNVIYEREKRQRLFAQGLNSRGTTRKNRRWTTLGNLRGNARKLAREQAYRNANVERGLTTNGKALKRHGLRASRVELEWREFRAAMNQDGYEP